MAEYKTAAQNNYGWGLTLEMTGKAPAVSKRVFDTLANAQAFIDDAKDSAIPGLVLTVFNDSNESNNGIYFVKSIGDGQTSGVLEKAGSGSSNGGGISSETDPVFSKSPAASITNADITAWNAKASSNTSTISPSYTEITYDEFFTGGQKVNKGDSYETAIGKVESSLNNLVSEVQKNELTDATIFNDIYETIEQKEEVSANAFIAQNTALGFDETGKYKPSINSKYISNASTVSQALDLLDSALGKSGSETVTTAFTTVGKVGNLASGSNIAVGTSVLDILKRILIAVIDVNAVAPTASLSLSSTSTPVEVGTKITQTLTASYTDGKFTGATSDYTTNQSAGCTRGDTTYKFGNTVIKTTASTSITDSERAMAEGENTWSISIAYSASSKTPKKNDGSNSTKSISASSAIASQKIVGAYKWFYGFTASISNTNYTSVFTTWDSLSALTSVWSSNSLAVTSMTSTSAKSALVVVIPSIYKISATQNSLGSNIDLAQWAKQNTITRKVGDTSHTYNVFVLHSGSAITYKNIKISK